MKQSKPAAAHGRVAGGVAGREHRRNDVLVWSQETPVLQKERAPTPQSESTLQNCRQVLRGCAAVEQALNSKHAEPGTQSVVSVQDSPGLAVPAEKQRLFGWEFWSHTKAQV